MTAVIAAVLNALVWPTLSRLALPLSVLTLGSCPFVLFPSALPYPERAVVGAEGMHRVLRHWLAELGHDAYRDAAAVTAADGAGSPPASR